MKDRIPTYPGRVTLTPVAGQENTYDMVMADEPTQLGDAPTKANLLDDDTCALLALDNTAVPNDAFQKLVLGAGNYAYAVTVTTSDGVPLSGVTVTGIKTLAGGTAVTNSDGYVLGVATTSSVTLAITTPFIDLLSVSQTVTHGTGVVKRVTLVMAYTAYKETTIASSKTFKFSPKVASFDVFSIGGGGSGGAAVGSPAAGGGGGGRTSMQLSISAAAGASYSAIIGSKGNAVLASVTDGNVYTSAVSGSAGGTTQLNRTLNGQTATFAFAFGGSGGGACGEYNDAYGAAANGGAGGSGGGGGFANLGDVQTAPNGGSDGSNGTSANLGSNNASVYGNNGGSGQGTTTRLWGEESGELYSGGGGGTSINFSSGSAYSGSGGSGGGGNGMAMRGYATSIMASSGTKYGGGGGGASNKCFSSTAASATSGAGYQGVMFLRWRYAA